MRQLEDDTLETLQDPYSLRCAPQVFQGSVGTVTPLQIQTAGLPGALFIDLDLLGDLTAIEFLYFRSDAPCVLRIGAAPAILTGVGGIFPTLFVGGETLLITIDGQPIVVTFLVGDQTAAQCVLRINAACALLGLATPRASVNTSGQIAISGVLTGSAAVVEVTGGTGAAQIGFPGTPSASGAGADVPVYGTFLAEFGIAGSVPAVPSRIQFSGTAHITVVAAGRTT